MSRAERRRAEREGRPAAGQSTPRTRLPPKVPGRHRWVAISSFTLTEGQAAAAARGAEVRLGPHNWVSTGVGCLDCEEEWPGGPRCAAAAAAEFAGDEGMPAGFDVVGGRFGLDEAGTEALLAAVDVVARSGGTAFEVSFAGEEDDPIHEARWWAAAMFRGSRIVAEDHPGPVEAAEGLAWRILDGGECTRCRGRISLEGHEERGPAGRRCRWRRVGRTWVPGCVPAEGVAGYVEERLRPWQK